jgi:hypothetical protein
MARADVACGLGAMARLTVHRALVPTLTSMLTDYDLLGEIPSASAIRTSSASDLAPILRMT